MVKIPVEVELMIKNTIGSVNAAFGGPSTEGKKQAKKTTGLLSGIMGVLGEMLGPILAIGTILSSLKITIKMVGQLLKIIQRFLRPIDFVIGSVLMTFLRLILPFVRLMSQIIRPIINNVRKINQNVATGKISPQQGIFQLIIEFGKIISIMFGGLISQIGKMIIDINLSAVQLANTLLSGFGILLLRALGLNEAANQFAVSSAKLITGIDLVKFTLKDLIDKQFQSFVESILNIQRSVDGVKDNSLNPFQQFLVDLGGTLDNTFGKELKSSFEGVNSTIEIFKQKNINLIDVIPQLSDKLVNLYSSTNATLNPLSLLIGQLNSFKKTITEVTSIIKSAIASARSISRGASRLMRSVVNDIKRGISLISPRGISIPTLTPKQSGTDFVNKTGYALLHRGERVIPADKVNSSGNQVINISINVPNGFIGSENTLANILDKTLTERLSSLTTYSRGVG